LTQKRAVTNLLEEFGMETARPRRVPMLPGEKVQNEGELLNTQECPYAKLVGSLLYLANCTRPDIAQSVEVLSTYMSCATINNRRVETGKVCAEQPGGDDRCWIGIWEQTTRTGGLLQCKSCWGRRLAEIDDGICLHYSGGTVSWASKLQPTMAFSTVEAKYMAAAHATKETLWLKKLCNDLDLKSEGGLIECDNQGTIQLVKHPIASQRSKHIDISHHFVWKRVLMKEIRFEYCSADLLTKALAPAKFESCCKMCGIT
jgi:hypothetical protein